MNCGIFSKKGGQIMRNINQNSRKAICCICAAIVLWTLGVQAAVLPPDPNNTALLYYQAFLLRPEPDDAAEELVYNTRQKEIYKVLRGGKFEPDANTKELIDDLKERLSNRVAEPNEKMPDIERQLYFYDMGLYDELIEPYEKVRDVDPNEKIREYLRSCGKAIRVAQAASEISECDWGIQYSQGFNFLLPQLVETRHLVLILRADALLLAADGDYRAAFERCLMMRRFARHVGNDANLLYASSKGVDGTALKCIRLLLGYMKPDVDTLTWLKNQLTIEKGSPISPAKALKIDFELALHTLRINDRILIHVRNELAKKAESDSAEKEAQNLSDEQLLARARKPYAAFLNRSLQVMNSKMSYSEKHAKIQRLTYKLEEGFGSDPAANQIIMACADQVVKFYGLQVRHTAQFNALKAAIEIYLVKAKTRQLPKTLPDDLPKDPFSSEDFEYETTQEGFVLRCRTKPTIRTTFEFKVHK